MIKKLEGLSSLNDEEMFGISVTSHLATPDDSLSAALVSEFGEALGPVSLDDLDTVRREYASLIIQLDRLRAHLSSADVTSRHQGSDWSIKEILGHLIDTDRDIWWPRIKATLENDQPEYQNVDHEDLVRRHRWQELPLQDIIAQLMRVRWGYAMQLNGMSSEAFDRTGMHPKLGEMSVLKIVQLLVAHDAHYLTRIRAFAGLERD